ncbi:pseudouridine-5'-phosphate glycosidase [Skermanella stibiiresistens SB22]|uniref:Pseudouridine-5'-phosphate glycosidase n=1 Tax=Skermanella stibiiresistens SB22 TaxID=1385369 RepID=W9H3K8_9PROT|nr:pseudouridine-5'-phosphate glycosidase [Skermanella stibiiresistens]EWY39312.1 pseudouridine-5'-phosphate glycosidase [Skermanella stibiiresistens SB22]
MHDYLAIHPEVAEALQARKAVVALESTIISHGMPYPRNVETARLVEQTIRDAGAVPATIAVLDGRIRVGLTDDDLEHLANRRGDGSGGDTREVIKVSRRDLPVALATRADGATTVAATMICAALAEIPVFATGGIGGVHRGAENTFDISADLDELAMTNVAVVCAGAKAILDLPKTVEYLETRGVPVIGYGTDELPAFYTRTSGIKLASRCDDPATVARILRAKWQLGLDGGAVIANPIPQSAALDQGMIDGAIAKALEDAHAGGVMGKDVTPFLLSRIEELTGGASLEANIALVRNNAAVAASIAHAYAELSTETALPPKPHLSRTRAWY